MKKLRILVSVLFFGILLTPVILMNRTENVTSEIDNRNLTNNPFGENFEWNENTDITVEIESYLQDRIGFRDDMITEYTVLNDQLFHEMVHPTYMYGQDGYVFSKLGMNQRYGEYQEIFADMVKTIQDYCEERNVPFLFVFNPSKASVLDDKLPMGLNYDSSWVTEFMEALDARGVNYADNTKLLKEKTAEGEAVFNQKYNAGHWNDLGAFYGVNHMLEQFQREIPEIHVNEKSEFHEEDILNTSLMVSRFPIEEYEPVFSGKMELEDVTSVYDAEVKRDDRYRHFAYIRNPERRAEGAPKVLVFQGSYMNGMGYKFLENSFGEYIAVHDYQNVIDFDYYYNIFQPEAVIFEVAEYVFNDTYFYSEKMKNMKLNPAWESLEQLLEVEEDLSDLSVEVQEGDSLVTVQFRNLPVMTQYAYLQSGGKVFDLKRQSDDGDVRYEVTLDKKWYMPETWTVLTTDGKTVSSRNSETEEIQE